MMLDPVGEALDARVHRVASGLVLDVPGEESLRLERPSDNLRARNLGFGSNSDRIHARAGGRRRGGGRGGDETAASARTRNLYVPKAAKEKKMAVLMDAMIFPCTSRSWFAYSSSGDRHVIVHDPSGISTSPSISSSCTIGPP